MRLVFHAMLAVSVAVAVTGIALGAQARFAGGDPNAGITERGPLQTEPRRLVSFEQTIAPPVPLSPHFAADLAAPPRLTWRLEEGTDGARVELCPTSDFDAATTVRLDVRGDHVQLPAEWKPGVWYWRLRGRSRAYVGDRATPTWMLYVHPETAAASASDTID